MNSEAPTEAEALYAASKLITLPWFRGLVFLADHINNHAICEIEEANIDITLEEFGDNRGDTVQYSRVHGNACPLHSWTKETNGSRKPCPELRPTTQAATPLHRSRPRRKTRKETT